MRQHRARLVGALARWCGDLQLAEDGFADAVERALTAWTVEPPRDPIAWLTTVARNRIRDFLRSAEQTRTRAVDPTDADAPARPDASDHDDTLALMFACVHPSLDRGVHAPLILQVVVGVDTSDIATAFALPVATLSKRLVRAKQRLRSDPDSFVVPDGVPHDRVDAVLDAIYAAYSIEWLRLAGPDVVDHVTEHAIHASQLLLAALPRNHEVRGLAALLLYLHSRRDTRIEAGVLVPTAEQDEARWDRTLIGHAEALLAAGLKNRTAPPGQYELQAAIQSAHSSRITGEQAPWDTIARLHDALVLTTPSRGARVARAVAIARATEAEIGVRMLQGLVAADAAYESFQPFHAAMAALLAASDRSSESLGHLTRAIDLCTHTPSRRYLERLRAESNTIRAS